MSSSESPTSQSPQAEYQRRLEAARAESQQLKSRDLWISRFRWSSFLVLIVVLGLGGRGYVNGWWVLLPLTAFIAAVFVHGRARRQSDLSKRRVELYEQGLRRLQDDWRDQPATGERYLDPEHVFTGDLDIFGVGSLFQLISWSKTRTGEDRLATWLSQAAEKPDILARQIAVSELSDNLSLREQLALIDGKRAEQFDPQQLRNWAMNPGEPISPGLRIAAFVLGAIGGLTLLTWLITGMGLAMVILVSTGQSLFLFAGRKRIFGVLAGMDKAEEGLTILSQVLDLIESRDFECQFLTHIQRRLEIDGQPPSKTVGHLASRIGYLHNSFRNQFFAPLAVMLVLPVHLAHSIENWRHRVGVHIDTWLDAVGDFEAIMSLSGYAWEHPDHVFPAIADDATVFVADDVGHPLLPASECIRNSVQLNSEKQLMLISGSNMSGKSTLLRTVGTNTALALAGSPVNARQMTVSVMQVGTAMRVSDSLQEGKSLFFAVLGRLKSVVDLATKEHSLLFLLDEILQGTNSHDRRIGAEAVIRSLVERGAVGMVTTHDLALTDISSGIPGTENVHFADSLKDGEMSFDYCLRPGVVQKSNAIELMRLVGLDV